jgi:hypothetical protein
MHSWCHETIGTKELLVLLNITSTNNLLAQRNH